MGCFDDVASIVDLLFGANCKLSCFFVLLDFFFTTLTSLTSSTSSSSEDDEKGEDMMYVCVCIIGTYIIFIEVLYYECIYNYGNMPDTH